MFAVRCYTPWIISFLFSTIILQINGLKSSHHHADYGWVFKVEDYKLKYAHMSTVEALPGDRLAHACQASAIKEGASDMAIWFQTGHATPKPEFDAATKVVSVQGYPVWGPVLHYDPVDAVLHLFYSQSGPFHPPNSTDFTNLSKSLMVGGEIRVVKSHDGGHTWDAPNTILAYNAGGVYDGAAKVTANKPAVLANGDWVLPFWQETPGTNNSFTVTHNGMNVGSWHPGSCAGVLLSHDRGHTWSPSGCIGNHYLIENTVAPVDDKGHLLMLFRSGGSPLYSSKSADWGVTWSNASATTIPNPNSKVFMYARPDKPDKLVLAYNPSTHGRKPLALADISDGGNIWGNIVTFDDHSSEYEYPTTAQINSTTYTTFSAPTKEGIKWASYEL